MMQTTCRLDGNHWVINGRKKFITGAEGARVGIVMAKSDDGACMFLVDLPDPAIRTLRVLDTIDSSMPGGHAEIEIENLRVSADQMLGVRRWLLEVATWLHLVSQNAMSSHMPGIS